MPTQLQHKIEKYKSDLDRAKVGQKSLQEKRDTIMKEISRGRNLVNRLKTKLTEFRSLRKRSKGGY